MAFGYCRCLNLTVCVCVCPRVRQSRAFPLENPSLVQARITWYGPKDAKYFAKGPYDFGVWLNLILWVKFNFISKSCFFASLLRPWNTGETCKNRWKRSRFHILNGCARKCWPTGSCHGPSNSRIVSLVRLLLASQPSTRRLSMYFICFCRLSPNYTYLTCRNFICYHSVMAETTVKPRVFAFIGFDFQHEDTRLRLHRCYF